MALDNFNDKYFFRAKSQQSENVWCKVYLKKIYLKHFSHKGTKHRGKYTMFRRSVCPMYQVHRRFFLYKSDEYGKTYII